MRLDVWSILIIVFAVQGLFLLGVLLFAKGEKFKPGRTYLMLIILVLLWFLAEFFSVRQKLDLGLNLFYGTRYGSWFLLGPIMYFYFNAITKSEWKLRKKDLVQFIPFVLFVVVIPLIAYKALNDRQVDYGMLSVFDHREKVLTTIQWTYSVVFILQFMHLGYFLIKNLKVVKTYSKGLSREYASIAPAVGWLKNLNIALLLVLVLSAIFLYILLITDIYRRHLDYIYVLPIGVLFYWISFRFMRTSIKPVENGSKYVGSSLSAEEIPAMQLKLEDLMQEQEVYLNNTIRLADLAQQMGMSKHHLSQLINQEYGMSFFDFINRSRVERAKELIAAHPEYKMLQVAFDSGFNNKTSFVNAFKKFEGITPSRYRAAN